MASSVISKHLQLILVSIALMIGFLDSGCSKKKSDSRDETPAAPAADPAAPAPTETLPPPTQDIHEAEKNSDVGETVPPIDETAVTVISTKDAPAVKHLVFNATETTEAARYKSEFLLVVHASESSCVRIKVRPSDGLDTQISTKDFTATGSAACTAAKPGDTDVASASPTPTPAPSASASASPTLHLTGASVIEKNSARWSKLSWLREKKSSGALALTASTPAICSQRLFRMPTTAEGVVGESAGIEDVTTKTGRLVYSGAKVRVWLDSEAANLCNVGATPANGAKIPFGPLIMENPLAVPADSADKLTVQHINAVASETEKSLAALTALYGNVSDVDGTGTVEVFISPDVNRQYFVKQRTSIADHFRASLILKHEDLAKYNAQTNALSNEAEVIYMWAPDPAGLYSYGLFPSSNSLASNYAIGYVASQIMSLIITNKHMIERKDKPMEDQWLYEALCMLAASYRGGNDYPLVPLANYLTSRPQHLSITDPLDMDLFATDLAANIRDEQLGLRTIFGWYIHTRLCDSTVNPCAAISQLVDSDNIGTENVSKVLGADFNELVKQFGVSVALGIAENPTNMLNLWQSSAGVKDLPEMPVTLPPTSEVRTSEKAQTAENSHSALSISAGDDRSQAGPFPSRKMLLFQPVLPDGEMEFKVAKNSVTYILVTGLIEPSTDATAVLGRGLNVTFIPMGERNSAIRQIVTEKISEGAHRDLRPTNLTQTVDVDHTFYNAPEFPSDVDLTVTQDRELWVLGSIDNFTINQSGLSTSVGDTDSYNVKVDPCAGKTGTALTACQSTDHLAVVQLVIRDFEKELDPMFFVTTTRLGMFRGSTILGRVQEIDPVFVESKTDETKQGILCHSEITTVAGSTSYANCANAGISAAQYNYAVCTVFAADGTCNQSSLKSASVYDAVVHNIKPTAFQPMYDNFFFSGPFGYPYYNNSMMYIFGDDDSGVTSGYRMFHSVETNRQFFNYVYTDKLKANRFHFYTLNSDAILSDKYSNLSEDVIGKLLNIKDAIDSPPASVSEDFVIACTSFGFSSINCKAPGPGLESDFFAWRSKNLPRIVCYNMIPTSCLGYSLTLAGTHTQPWILTGELANLWSSSGSYNGTPYYTTYYQPVEPYDRSDSYCLGDVASASTVPSACLIKRPPQDAGEDIRRQFNTAASRFREVCLGERIKSDFDVCGDFYGHAYETRKTNELPASLLYTFDLSTDRLRDMRMQIAHRAGEMIGKPKRLHPILVKVPGTGDIIHVMIGGRKQSQGKYLMRVRQVDFD